MEVFIRKKQAFTYNRGAMARGGNTVKHGKCTWLDVPVCPDMWQIWGQLCVQIAEKEARRIWERDRKKGQLTYNKKYGSNAKRREAAKRKGGAGFEPRKPRGKYKERV